MIGCPGSWRSAASICGNPPPVSMKRPSTRVPPPASVIPSPPHRVRRAPPPLCASRLPILKLVPSLPNARSRRMRASISLAANERRCKRVTERLHRRSRGGPQRGGDRSQHGVADGKRGGPCLAVQPHLLAFCRCFIAPAEQQPGAGQGAEAAIDGCQRKPATGPLGVATQRQATIKRGKPVGACLHCAGPYARVALPGVVRRCERHIQIGKRRPHLDIVAAAQSCAAHRAVDAGPAPGNEDGERGMGGVERTACDGELPRKDDRPPPKTARPDCRCPSAKGRLGPPACRAASPHRRCQARSGSKKGPSVGGGSNRSIWPSESLPSTMRPYSRTPRAVIATPAGSAGHRSRAARPSRRSGPDARDRRS